jgi:tetratricopeptide (TPR) repeat protein/class 3 adenylate cyclase
MPHAARHLAVILFTDIVGSVDLKNRLGTESYSDLLSRHRELFAAALALAAGGKVVQHTGDGFLVEFATSSQAVSAALAFQFLLSAEAWGKAPLRVRVGIHQGEVLDEGAEQAAHHQLVGLAVDLAARVMGLAMGGQILLTRSVFDDARQYVRRHPEMTGKAAPPIRWVAHGRYLFKGMDADDSLEVCEVGGEGVAPLVRPPDGEKAHRAVAADEEETLGWRPAVGLAIPGRPGWVVERKLGEGGFGEVWLATHERLHEGRVFKFCFDAERLRSFKREVTLFRLLRETLGKRKDFLPLFGIELGSPPYYIESEFVPGGNLAEWALNQGGIEKVPLATRLRLLAETARAVAAAHSVGIIHKDIKPSNILVGLTGDGLPTPRLCDFGIGVLADRTRLRQADITEIGFTETLGPASDSSRSGTRVYLAPEYLVDKPATMQGDIYALGVVLYQLVVADLNRPLAPGWERDVDDELLREDIARCVDKDPANRFPNAENLALSIERLDQRRAERQRLQAAQRRAVVRRRMVRLAGAGAAVLLLVAALCGVGYFRERVLRGQAEDSTFRETLAHRQALAAQKAAQQQRDLALETLKKLVFEIQDKLEARVGMHALRENLLNVAVSGLQQVQGSLSASEANGTLNAEASRSTAYALTRLGSLFQVTGRTAEALAPLQKAQAMFSDLAARAGDDPRSLEDLVTIHDQLAHIYLAIGRSRDGMDCARSALAFAERTAKDPNVYRRCLVTACGTMGDVAMQMGQPGEAMKCYRRSQELLEAQVDLAALSRPVSATSTAARSEESEKRRSLATVYSRLGDVCLELGELPKAREYYLRDLYACQALVKDSDIVYDRRNLAVSYGRMSDIELLAGRTQEALDAQLKSLELFQALADAQSEDTQSRNDLAICLSRLGTLYMKMGLQTASVEAFRKALDIRQALCDREPANALLLRNLFSAYLDAGFAHMSLAHGRQALPYYEQAIKISQSLADADPSSPEAQRDLTLCHNDLGWALTALGQGAAALEHYQASLRISQALAKANPQSTTARRDLAIAYNRVGEQKLALGDPNAALEAYGEARRLYEDLAGVNPDSAEARNDLAVIYFRLGGLHARLNRPAEAEPYYLRAEAIDETLAGDPKDAEAKHNLSVVCNCLGDLKMSAGEVPAALGWYDKSLTASKALAANPDNAEGRRDLAIAYAKLAGASLVQRQPEKALEQYRQAEAIDAASARADPNGQQAQRDWVVSLINVAIATSQMGDHAESADCYRRALAALDRMRSGGILAEDMKDWPDQLREEEKQETRQAATQPASRPAQTRPVPQTRPG